MFRCTFCGKEFEGIPADATKLGKACGSTQMVRFSDGTIHNLVSARAGKRKQPHPGSPRPSKLKRISVV